MNNFQPLIPEAEVQQTAPEAIPTNSYEEQNRNANEKNNALNTFQEIGASSSINNNSERLGQTIANAMKSNDSSAKTNTDTSSTDNAISDERMKELFGDYGADLVECIARLGAYKFRYKKEAQEKYGADNDSHVGVMAQELEKNPATPNVVEELPDGTKTVDTKELTTANTAIIAELAKRVMLLEAKIGDK